MEPPATAPWGRRIGASLVAVGMVVVVGVDGSLQWRVVRVLLVLALSVEVARRPAIAGARLPAVEAIALGVVAATVGATFGWSHLTTPGWSITALAAVVGAAGGLVLIGSGVAALLHGSRWWWWLASVPIALLVGYVVVVPVAVAVYATNVARPALGDRTPSDLGLPYRDAWFSTADGVRLSGWYLPSRNGAAVVALHGASSTRTSVLTQAAVLARHGYGVLLVDARGHGRSGGRAMDLGWYGDEDVTAAVSWLADRPEVDPGRIGALGLSMGGEEALGAMAADDRIQAVVAEGATGRVAHDDEWLSDEFGFPGVVQEGVGWWKTNLTDVLTAAHPPTALRTAVAGASPRPVLLVAAGDVEDEELAARWIQRGSPATVSVWVVPGSGHTAGLQAQRSAWTRHVVRFFDEKLAG